jgi:hypothetical protein
MRTIVGIVVVACAARGAAAQPSLEPEIHGFASEGAFVSTSNDYIGKSSRGSLEMFEAGLNVTTQVDDHLRFGFQLFSRDVGDFGDATPRIDWAFVDYRWRPELGVRAGIVKMPFGLYNEFIDVDAARLPILMPQSVYQTRNRDVLISHTGFALYGNRELGSAGELDYQAFLGTLRIPRDALTLQGADLVEADTKYVTGAQVTWTPPVEGLRLGTTFVRTSIDFHLQLDAANTQALIDAGLVPPDYDGKLLIAQRPDMFGVVSAEYTTGDWLFAAEYSRWWKRQISDLPMLLPTIHEDAERFYAMANRRLSERFEVGGYYSINHADVGDRLGHGMGFAKPYYAWQRDLAATVEFDATYHWIWKLEAHFIDGTADLTFDKNPDPDRYWALVLLKTTVFF